MKVSWTTGHVEIGRSAYDITGKSLRYSKQAYDEEKLWNSVNKLVEQGEEIDLKIKVEKVSGHTQYDSPLGANIFLFDIATRQTCPGTLSFCRCVCQVRSQAWREGTAVRKAPPGLR